MTTVNHRHERIGEEITHEINAMLAGELKDPRLEVSVVVNQVQIAQDMRHAKVLNVKSVRRHQIPRRLQFKIKWLRQTKIAGTTPFKERHRNSLDG